MFGRLSIPLPSDIVCRKLERQFPFEKRTPEDIAQNLKDVKADKGCVGKKTNISKHRTVDVVSSISDRKQFILNSLKEPVKSDTCTKNHLSDEEEKLK